MKCYQPKTGQPCHCRPGQARDNCPQCEGTGWRIDFAAIRAATAARREQAIHADVFNPAETDLQYLQRRQRELGIKP